MGDDTQRDLADVVYERLRAIAARHMSGERTGHTLQTTALVHEAWIAVADRDDVDADDRAGFYRVAAAAMRRLLIDHARAKGRVKRGGDRRRVPLTGDVMDLADADPDEIVALDSAIQRLLDEDARCGEIVRLRFWAGLDVDETARALDLSRRTVLRDWAFARARLIQIIEDG